MLKSIWNQIAQYLFLKKGDKPANFNTKMMHGMNRISILLFIICLLILAYRLFIRS